MKFSKNRIFLQNGFFSKTDFSLKWIALKNWSFHQSKFLDFIKNGGFFFSWSLSALISAPFRSYSNFRFRDFSGIISLLGLFLGSALVNNAKPVLLIEMSHFNIFIKRKKNGVVGVRMRGSCSWQDQIQKVIFIFKSYFDLFDMSRVYLRQSELGIRLA